MFKPSKSDRKSKGFRSELEELVAMLRTYAVQEIVGPLRGIGRFIGFGLAGSIFVSLSVLLGGLGLLRFLQAEVSLFEDTWSFVPYLITAAAMLLILAVLIGAITRSETDADAATASTGTTADTEAADTASIGIGQESEHTK